MRYPRLEALRAQREAREDEIAQPFIEAAEEYSNIAAAEFAKRRALERTLTSKFLPKITDNITYKMGTYASRTIVEAVLKAIKKPTGPVTTVTVQVPTDALLIADHRSIVARVVAAWREESLSGLRVWAAGEEVTEEKVAILHVSIPEMAYSEYSNGSS